MEKTIHVDAYTRSDGTHVREHERHINTNGDYQDFESNENKGLLENLKEILAQSKTRENELLEKLSQIGAGNQADLLKEYANQKNKNSELQEIFNIVESALPKETKRNIANDLLKTFMDTGINTFGYNLDNAKQLWNIASHGFDGIKNSFNEYQSQALTYTNNHGKFISRDEIPLKNDDKNVIVGKIQKQLGTLDVKGILFDEKSPLSKKIVNSKSFRAFLDKNRDKLNKGDTIKSSIKFRLNDLDLAVGLGKVDILGLHLRPDGKIEGYVFDTYDFNKGGINPLVNIGRKLQDKNMLYGYYTLTKIICD